MGISRLNDLTIEYPNRGEFLSLKKEIFINEDYFLDSVEEGVIIDIGSYIGLSTIYFRLQHPGVDILSYEPIKPAFSYLVKNTSSLDRVSIFNKGVSIVGGEMDLYLTNSQENWLSNSSYKDGSWTGKELTSKKEVDMVSMNSILEENTNISVLKIDVEGYELKLFKSEPDLSNVSNILVEIHPTRKDKVSKLLHKLSRDGFSLEFRKDGKVINNYDPEELFILRAYK